MSKESSLDDVIQQSALLRGRDITVSPLGGGSLNGVFLAEAEGERYVIRVPGAASDLLGTDRDVERANVEIAAGSRVAPRILEYLDDDVMLLEFVEGTVPAAKDLQTPEQVVRMAEACRRLHAGPRFVNDFDMHAKVVRWRSICAERAIETPDGAMERMKLVDEVAGCLAVRPLSSVPCHNDLAPYNFIDDGRQLWMIDFEFSGNHDPCNDLGGLASEVELDDELRRLLCASYFGEATSALLARMTLYNLIALVGWTLYCSLLTKLMDDTGYWEGALGYWGEAIKVLDSEEISRLMQAVL
jgi:thiamine kinase-like enzyme